jgi:hypothetical protein
MHRAAKSCRSQWKVDTWRAPHHTPSAKENLGAEETTKGTPEAEQVEETADEPARVPDASGCGAGDDKGTGHGERDDGQHLAGVLHGESITFSISSITYSYCSNHG